jgi:hypothetical protein
LSQRKKKAICTLVFDREAYQPALFAQVWNTYCIAIITCRKFVKDKWDEQDFVIESFEEESIMCICEKQVVLDSHNFREVRCLRPD